MADMERLTKRNDSGGITVYDMSAALAKLAELEDAEQSGRLLTRGDTVYRLCQTDAETMVVKALKIASILNDEMGVTYRVDMSCGVNDCTFFTREDIGKNVFLSNEEAKAALQERVT